MPPQTRPLTRTACRVTCGAVTLLLTAMAAAGLVFETGGLGWLMGSTSPAHAAQWRRQPWAYAASLDDVAVRFQQQDADPQDWYVCVNSPLTPCSLSILLHRRRRVSRARVLVAT